VRAGVTAALALAAVGGAATTAHAAAATQQSMALSSLTGSQAGGNTLTLTLAGTASPKFNTLKPGVQFQSIAAAAAATATCATAPATSAQSTVPNASVRYITSTKVSVVVPDLSAVTGATAGGYWLVCAYSAPATGSGGTVIPVTTPAATVVAKANYLVATAPTLNATTPVVPTNGPATGGQTITVMSNASDFPTSITAATPLTATLGGVALTNITPIDASSFTAVTPSRPASSTAVVLSVTTAGGTVTSSTGLYTYVNGLTVSPNTVPGGQSVDVDIQGVGFSTLDFAATAGTTPESLNAHVYLVQGAYDPSITAATPYSKTVGEKTECVNVAVISDSELICTVNAAKKVNITAGSAQTVVGAGTAAYATGTLPDGSYTVTVVNHGGPLLAANVATTVTYQTVLSSGATFTVANF